MGGVASKYINRYAALFNIRFQVCGMDSSEALLLVRVKNPGQQRCDKRKAQARKAVQAARTEMGRGDNSLKSLFLKYSQNPRFPLSLVTIARCLVRFYANIRRLEAMTIMPAISPPIAI
jgi:hypothetical protein